LFYALLVGAHEPSRKLQGLFTVVHMAGVASGRVFPLIDHQSTIVSPPNPTPMPEQPRELQYKAVNFAYNPAQPVLNNLDLTVPAGETLAIVGHSGCGKTTLASLALRFYDPVAGAVALDGIDLRQLDLLELRKRIGLVSQQPLMFADSVKD